MIDKKANLIVDTCTFSTNMSSKRTTDAVPSSYEERIKKLQGKA